MPASADSRLAQALQSAPPGAPLAALVEGDDWSAPLAPLLLRWVRGEGAAEARATLPLRSRELSEWCAALLAECEALVAAPRSPFDLLEVDPAAATPASVREQFRKLALASHPDRRPLGERATWQARQVELNLAYEKLKTEEALAAERRALQSRRALRRHFALVEIDAAHVADLAARARRWLGAPIPPAALPPLVRGGRPHTRRRRAVFVASFVVTAVGVALIAWISQQPAGIARPLSLPNVPPHHGAPANGGAAASTPAPAPARPPSPPGVDQPGVDPFELGPSASLDFKPAGVSRPTPTPTPTSTPTPMPPPAASPPSGTPPSATPDTTPAPVPAIDPADLDRFLAAYDLAYRQGDLPRLRALFARDVVQNGADSFDTIMERYERFFAQAERVEMTSARLRHRLHGGTGGDIELVAVYSLKYELRAPRRPGQPPPKPERREMEGDFTMHLRPDADTASGFRIVRLDF